MRVRSSAAVLATFALAGMVAPAAASAAPQTVTGKLMWIAGAASHQDQFLLDTEGPTLTLALDGSEANTARSLTGRRVRVVGEPSGRAFDVAGVAVDTSPTASSTSVSAALATNTPGVGRPPGNRSLAVVLIQRPGTTPPSYLTPENARHRLFGEGQSARVWLEETSSGSASLHGNVFGWIPTPSNAARGLERGGRVADRELLPARTAEAR